MAQMTLCLNSSYEPLSILSWERAICMWLDGKVEILETYAERVYDAINDWTGHMPAVVRLIRYVKVRRNQVKFSRVNVFGRDFHTCQYCGSQPGTELLTYDHVMPRSRGGKTSWDNITTACIDCNLQKGDRTPEEAGMKLANKPVKPTTRPKAAMKLGFPNTPDEWREYLYWGGSLEQG